MLSMRPRPGKGYRLIYAEAQPYRDRFHVKENAFASVEQLDGLCWVSYYQAPDQNLNASQCRRDLDIPI